jgi:rubrerythrin
MSGGKILVESKDDIKVRLGRSTDDGDAVMMAFWPRSGGWLEAMGVVKCKHCDEPYLLESNPKMCPHCRTPHEEP